MLGSALTPFGVWLVNREQGNAFETEAGLRRSAADFIS